MSKSGTGGDDGDGKPDDSGEPGMAIIRRQRRATLEKALRAGSSGAEAQKPNAAAAWGTMLQREVRGEAAKPEAAKAEPAKAETAKTEPAKTEPAKTEPAKTEPARSPPPAKAPTTGALPRVPSSATTGSIPRVPGNPTTGSMPRIPANPTTGSMPRIGTASAPLPNVDPLLRPGETGPLPASVRAPSTAAPEDVAPSPEMALAREANQLATAHEERESRSRFRILSVRNLLRLAAAAVLCVACGWLMLAPALTMVDRAERQHALAGVVSEVVARIEADPGLAPALAAHDATALQAIFERQQASGLEALRRAGFVSATEGTLRARRADAGRALAVSAEFPEVDGEVVAATRKTGVPEAAPPVPALLDVLLDEYALNVAALSFTALAGVFLLVVWPWLRRRRRA